MVPQTRLADSTVIQRYDCGNHSQGEQVTGVTDRTDADLAFAAIHH
jgi:hypothetical protein